MASTYENDLRLEEMATGENSGSWGTKTNTNLELIADAFSYGTETIANADTTITIADGAADAARSLALKINSSEDLTTTRVVTLAPNTTSKVWIIENNTSGGQTLTISAGSGSNITLLNGQTKIIATDGIGAGSNVVELTQDIAIADLFVDDDLSLQSDGAIINFGADADITLTHAADTSLTLGGAGSTTGLIVNNTATDGDPFLSFALSGTQTFTMGIDDGDSDKFKIGTTAIDTNTRLTIDSSGDVEVNQGNFTVTSIGTGAAAGPYLNLSRNSSSPADDDAIGMIQFNGKNDQDESLAYVQIQTNILDATDATEDGYFRVNVRANGSLEDSMTISNNNIIFNDSGLDRDFRVESDSNTHMLFVDAGNDQVNIGTSTDLGGLLNLNRTDGSFIVMNGTSNNKGYINWESNGFTFYTNGPAEALRIGSSEMNVNEDSRDYDFRVESDSDTHMFFVDAGNNRVSINSSGLGAGDFNVSGNTILQHSGIVSSQSNTALTIRDADSTNMRANFVVEDNINSSRGGLMIQATESGVTNDRDIYLQPHGGRVGILTASPASGFDCRTAAVFNEAGANNDFRVESDTQTHQLFVDSSVPSTSVGLSSPSYMFEVYHPTTNTVARFQSGDADVWIALQASGNTPADHRIGYETSQDTVTIISGGVTQIRAYPSRVDFPHCANATAALPGLTISDSNTGIYDPGADLFGFSCGGQHVATFGETSGTSFFSVGAAVKSAVAGVGRKGWSVEEDTAGGDVRHSVQADNTIYKIYSTQSGQQCGGIEVSGSGTTTTFNTSSDYRLKENVASMTGSIDRLKQLNPVTYDWISSGQAAEGFLAHESQTVVPDSVTGTKDATEEIGTLTKGGVVRDDHCTEPASLADDEVWTRTSTEPVYQQIDHSRLVPLLTSALQEAVAKIEALETRVAALENA